METTTASKLGEKNILHKIIIVVITRHINNYCMSADGVHYILFESVNTCWGFVRDSIHHLVPTIVLHRYLQLRRALL